MSLLKAEQSTAPIFLCRKAAELPTSAGNLGTQFIIDSIISDGVPSEFQRGYIARTGANPGFAAYEIYRGVHSIAQGLRANGANRVLLRDYLAGEGNAQFDAAGNDRQSFAVVRLQPAKP